MQLRSVTFQSTPEVWDKPFSERYQMRLAEDAMGMRFLRLIEHLERHVEAPPQWVCTSHHDLHFFDCDLKRFVGFGESPHWTLAVQVGHTGFTLITHAHPPWVSDAERVEHPETTEEAAAIIADILEKRGNWVEMRWMREQREEAKRK